MRTKLQLMAAVLGTAWFLAGCTQEECPASQVLREGECRVACNNATQCADTEQCLDGACLPTSGGGSSGAVGSSAAATSNAGSSLATSGSSSRSSSQPGNGSSSVAGSSTGVAVSSSVGGSSASQSGSSVGSTSGSAGSSSSAAGQSTSAQVSSSAGMGTSNPPGSSSSPGGCLDVDLDGRGVGCPAGPDCDDADPLAFATVSAAVDADGDGATFGPAVLLCTNGNIPAGYAVRSAVDDCDETSPNIQTGCGACVTLPFGGRVWQVCNMGRDRSPAASDCATRGMFLASIHNAQESEWIGSVIGWLNLGARVWIGLRETPSPMWEDNSAVDFFNYPNGATTGGSAAEGCVTIVAAGTWDDDDCAGHSYPYICASAP